MLSDQDVEALGQGRHGDPFAALGPHAGADGVPWVHAFLPGAVQVQAVAGARAWPLALRDATGVFEGPTGAQGLYQLRVRWQDGSESLVTLEDLVDKKPQ